MQASDSLETHIGSLGAVDHRAVNWAQVRWTACLIHQHLRYDYPGHIHDLRQRLMLVPPDTHGDQRLVTYKLEVSAPVADTKREIDAYGNSVSKLSIDYVEQAIDFTAWIVVERDARHGPLRLPHAPGVAFVQPSALTQPDDALRFAAATLRTQEADDLTLATLINQYVYKHFTYGHGATGVRTTAAEAFHLARGVCQDYAHVMLALCRCCGIPARYVSGHLLGEGGTHAWVEALLRDPQAGGTWTAYPFDPTHGRMPWLNYLTVAVGRDYGDVAPTSGSFRAPYAGHLSTKKRAGVTAIEYAA